jgi:hypothetical protein
MDRYFQALVWVISAMLTPNAARPAVGAQASALAVDSLHLRYMRIRAQATDTCLVVVTTSGSMGIATDITPANIQRWIDTATAYVAARPRRAKGEEVRYVWFPITLGVRREITDRHDAVSLEISGHTIPMLASEVPRIAKLLDGAARETLRASHMKSGCPTAPDR